MKKEKAITAQEAKELTDGSMKRKGLFFKLRLYFMCGLVNSQIENKAELGLTEARIENDETVARQYYPLMASFYENLGYYVRFDYTHTYNNKFVVCWDISELSGYEKYREYEYSSEKDPFKNMPLYLKAPNVSQETKTIKKRKNKL